MKLVGVGLTEKLGWGAEWKWVDVDLALPSIGARTTQLPLFADCPCNFVFGLVAWLYKQTESNFVLILPTSTLDFGRKTN